MIVIVSVSLLITVFHDMITMKNVYRKGVGRKNPKIVENPAFSQGRIFGTSIGRAYPVCNAEFINWSDR